MACYYQIINRLRVAFDPLEGEYFEWNHKGNIHCFVEQDIEKLLMPMFKEWYSQSKSKNLDDHNIESAKEKYWRHFLLEWESDIIDYLDDIANDTEVAIGKDPEDTTDIYNFSVYYNPEVGYIYSS